jgi:ribonucleoside-triphosphate reductase
MENVNNVDANNICHDCKKEIEVVGEEIQNGVSLVYDLPAGKAGNAGEKINVLKCNDCYTKNPALTNFQECEVYSRVVGYLRPVSQWHKGKKQEYGERKEFGMPSGESCC